MQYTVQHYAYKSIVLKKKLFVIITELTNGENKTKQNKTRNGHWQQTFFNNSFKLIGGSSYHYDIREIVVFNLISCLAKMLSNTYKHTNMFMKTLTDPAVIWKKKKKTTEKNRKKIKWGVQVM